MAAGVVGHAQTQSGCPQAHPPSLYLVTSSYPFQAGSEKTFDELYHGPWRARVDIALVSAPRRYHHGGTIRAGTVVEAVEAESIVVHPLRFIAARDFQVGVGFRGGRMQVATLSKGDPFWVLDVSGEGFFHIWWRCHIYVWDSTEPSAVVHEDRLRLLGTNEERWVKIRDPKTGVSGWFRDMSSADGPNLIPAQTTSKATG